MPIVLVVVIRSFIGFFVLLFLIRLIGKQQVSQLTFFDYIVGITIGSAASTLSVQVNENTLATIIGMVVWSGLAILLAALSLRSPLILKLVEGKETVVIENGHINEANLKKIRITIEELVSELRAAGVFNIQDVEFALFERNGKLSVQKKSQKQPVTPSDLNIPTAYEGLPSNLIQDGQLQKEALSNLKLSKAWLMYQLSKQNITDITQVSFAQLDTKGNLFVDLKDDDKNFVIPTAQG
jgi:uncharacterized membrane protein YcaP (DUF421 family)